MHAFTKFEEKLKPVVRYADVPEERIAAYRGRLPDVVLDWWRASGWCSYGDGLLCTVDPDAFAETPAPFLAEGETAAVLMRTAMGALVTWNGTEGHIHDMVREEKIDLYESLEDALNSFFTRDTWLESIGDRDIFTAVAPVLGTPAWDECYGYFPPIALGGSGTNDEPKRVKLREHLHFLSQL